jgi:hypothetical protein
LPGATRTDRGMVGLARQAKAQGWRGVG